MSDEQMIDFAPIRGFKASEVPLDAPPGQWVGTFHVLKRSLAKDSDQVAKFPMLTLGITLSGADNPDNESYEGVQLKDWLTIYPNGHKNQRMGKDRLAGIAGCLGFDSDSIVPEEINGWDDLQPLIDAIDGKQGVVFTYIGKVRGSETEKETKVAYTAPRRRGN